VSLRKELKLSQHHHTHTTPASSQSPNILDAGEPKPKFSLDAVAPPNLSSPIRLSAEDEAKIQRENALGTNYGGKNDAAHLGGWLDRDNNTVSLSLYNFLMGPMAVKSVIDVGCGRGFTPNYFRKHGARVLCVEGSRDAVSQSLLPQNLIVEHDFSRGPWWPSQTFDVAWSTEFLEHVGRQYMRNYMPIFKKAALIFVTSSAFGGWHHVEVNADWWWRGRFISNGFVFSQELTDIVRSVCTTGDHFENTNAQLLKARLLVFINPAVASLEQHDHLFGGHGCFSGENDNRDGGAPCTGSDSLPSQYQSLLNCKKNRKNDKMEWRDVPWDCVQNQNPNVALIGS